MTVMNAWNIMNNCDFNAEVVILAGGFGRRLAEVIGDNTPKPMALIDGKPLLEYQVDLCVEHGFNQILILLHYRPEAVMNYFGTGESFGADIRYSIESVPRGTAGAIFDSLALVADSFLVIYGDTFLDVNLRKFFNAKASVDAVLTFCHPNSHPFDSDLLTLDANGKVEKVFRPSTSGDQYYRNLVNAALYVMDKEAILKYVSAVGQMDISSELFPSLITRGEFIQAYISPEYIKDMGTPQRYQVVNRQVQEGIPLRLSDKGKRRCVFLDRDGVINLEVGHLSNVNDFELLEDVSKAIGSLNDAGYLVICVTNQPVVARGELTEDGLSLIHMKMEAELGKEGAYLDHIYHCPHHPDSGFPGEITQLKMQCECRKPNPGMLLQAIEDFGIDPSVSWLIGDHMRDIVAGKAVGAKTILVGSDSYAENDSQLLVDYRFGSLFPACEWILKS
jgi:D,D-heptose 1,7-bisphosphate phosphatase